jgi:hypothetical protein
MFLFHIIYVCKKVMEPAKKKTAGEAVFFRYRGNFI